MILHKSGTDPGAGATWLRRAASYERVTLYSDGQPDEQFALNRTAAARYVYELPDELTYRFTEHSPNTNEHGSAFSRLIAVVQSGAAPFEAIFVSSTHVLGGTPDAGALSALEEALASTGIALIYSDGSPHASSYDSAADLAAIIKRRVWDVMSAHERRETHARSRRGVRVLVHNGYYPSRNVPYGMALWRAELATGQLVSSARVDEMYPRRGYSYKLRPAGDATTQTDVSPENDDRSEVEIG